MKRNPSTPSTADADSNTFGAVVGLAIACGAVLIMACAFAYASCRWRMKYLKMQRKVKNNSTELKPDSNADIEVIGQEALGQETVATGALPAEASSQ
ncbi:hypothetical protein XA68_13145 [Ophiocordyceps unilateralis]|uniref:Uncharacterized protein n=1 Tax=Ophiocordyceps unilateralis TaxID=268505 RepID=A0A2A9PBP9_OPHUN|nr:hypothetical protein XA68_13145 [Ophiocordyceps unilateralis]